MRRISALLCVALIVPAPAWSHVVTTADAQARLLAAEAVRARNADAVDQLLSSPVATRVARRAGVDIERARRVVPTLSDRELEDLAARAGALETNPASGADGWVYMLAGAGVLLILLLIIGIAAANSQPL